ncbi:MAG: amidohydrolase [Selenomonas sp.]|nr:amidohydrolase [Selenomonas sp.]MCI7331489.1 amidohydrolase [Selenomonadaceae bacterium]MDD7056154.1 amidohydrolase [Selenomonadaceae bacterium]MDY3915767.1 amidohydrolase [Selenomonadaceae bacterium]
MLQISKDIIQKITEEFYWLHRHPELSYQEVGTTARLRAALARAGVRVLEVPLKTGLVAEIGTGEAPVVGLRADIDALPVTEQTGLAYASEKPGVMHACGHDFHMTSVLGAALYLKQHEKELQGTVRIVFQPAEEAPGGARDVLATHALDDVQALFGLHTSPLFPVGTVGVSAGAVTASVDKFVLRFTGKGTHAAHPERGVDPIVMASSFVLAVQSIISRNIDPAHRDLVSITRFTSGNTWNVIPAVAELEGTVRCLDNADRALIEKRLRELADGQAKSFGGSVEVAWTAGPPATDNTPHWSDCAREVAAAQGLTVAAAPVSLAGEDFAYYQTTLPGCFVLVGTGKSPANHNPAFRVDPAALGPAAAYLAALAMQALIRI